MMKTNVFQTGQRTRPDQLLKFSDSPFCTWNCAQWNAFTMSPFIENRNKKSPQKIFTRAFSYTESGSGSINGVAPKGSIFASNILLIIELPAMEAASPALKPGQKKKKKKEDYMLGEKQKEPVHCFQI